jgi:glycosyltransferase involved in cell wall biosynthesis
MIKLLDPHLLDRLTESSPLNWPLKVLWLTNSLLPDHAAALGKPISYRGGWMAALAHELALDERIELAVATNTAVAETGIETVKGVRYYGVPQRTARIKPGRLPAWIIAGYRDVIQDFRPDVLHVHGTEYFHGLLTGRGYLPVPTVISIQGIIDVCSRHYLGSLPWRVLLLKRTLRDWVRLDGLLEQKVKWAIRAKWEREIFQSHTCFIGQTPWDRAHLKKINPTASYFHHDRVLRQPFYEVQWDITRVRRYSIFTSSASYPLKGFHVLLRAVAILKDEFPDITIRTPLAGFYPGLVGMKRIWRNIRSGGYARFLTDLIRSHGLESHVIGYPMLDAEGMADHLLRTHVFVLPSFIENESVSLAEAMIVGAPSVASFVGGVPSMAKDEESALFFPGGDEAVLAHQIRRVFLDDPLACHLSAQARETARKRHDRERIVDSMIEVYEAVRANAERGHTVS